MKFRFLILALIIILASGYAIAQVIAPPATVAPAQPTVVAAPPAGTVMMAPAPVPVMVGGQPYCRPFKETFTIEHSTQVGRGTACLQSDGSWQIVSLAGGLTYLSRGNGVYIMAPQPFVEEKLIIEAPARHHY